MKVHIGVDVGGTNTDAVVVQGTNILSAVKHVTTADVTSGVSEAIGKALKKAQENGGLLDVRRVHIGTTHFVNALVERRHLVKVGVIRLCGPASIALPPFIDFPDDIAKELCGGVYMISGGHQFDAVQELGKPDEEELLQCLKAFKESGIVNIVFCGIFSPVNSTHEKWAESVVRKHFPEFSVTLSHLVGHLGLLERENAAILNESLKPLCEKTISAFRQALDKLGLKCPFFLTQNDGTLLSVERAMALPVYTISSGPTNSMRGAAYLSGVNDAVVVDVGGTSTDVGMLVSGFPREASTTIKISGVRTNFRMPDVISIGLGGGSLITKSTTGNIDKVKVGPKSVGFRLRREALVFGGKTLTASDVAVAAGLVTMGDKNKVMDLDASLINSVVDTWHAMLEELIDSIKTSESDVPVILVGGGSVLLDSNRKVKGVSHFIRPQNFQVANAIGAALSQVSGAVDMVVSLHQSTREEALKGVTKQAHEEAVKGGADPKTIKVVDILDTPMAYQPDDATRIKVRVVGDLKLGDTDQEQDVLSKNVGQVLIDEVYTSQEKNDEEETSHSAKFDQLTSMEEDTTKLKETEPEIDAATGEWLLSAWDVECIAIGAGILGCGGGGNPHIGKIRALNAIKQGKKLRVISPERVKQTMGDQDILLAAAFMGAPLIEYEKLVNGTEIPTAVENMMQLLTKGNYNDGVLGSPDNNKVESKGGIVVIDDFQSLENEKSEQSQVPNLFAITCDEIGGLNSIEPLLVGAHFDLPVIDMDGMGRAFPELQMFTPTIYGVPCYPGVIADEAGHSAVVLKASNPKQVEDYFRQVCVKYGCSAALSYPVFRKNDVDKFIPHSLSRAWRVGSAVLHAGQRKSDPVQAILNSEGGQLLIVGKIVNVQRDISGGFNRGKLHIEGLQNFSGNRMLVEFQNENLVATMTSNGKKNNVACTPDLITLVITETGIPVSTEELRYGLRVSVLALPASPVLGTEEALAYVGPKAFGYDLEYKPIGGYKKHLPIPKV